MCMQAIGQSEVLEAESNFIRQQLAVMENIECDHGEETP